MLNTHKGLIIILLTLILTASCKKDFTTVGNHLIEKPRFEGKLFTDAEVKIYDQQIDKVYSCNSGNENGNNLPVQSIGIYNDAVMGKLKADLATSITPLSNIFSNDYNTNVEILNAQLVVPYFSHTYTDEQNPDKQNYELDSIYGNNPFEIKIYELTYLLPSYDPATNLETHRRYYSDFDFTPYKGRVIGDTLSFETSSEPVYVYKRNEDGSYELDDDGERIVSDSLTPRMRINLDKNFFKEKIFDHWGEDILIDSDRFKDYFRGLYIEAVEENNDGKFIIAQFDAAKIQIDFTYETVDDNETPDDTSDDTTKRVFRTIELRLSTPMVNHYENLINTDAQTALENSDPVNGDAQIYLKGDAYSEAVVQLFNEQQLRDLRLNDWMINEADLYIYVDQNMTSDLLAKSQRLLIFNYDEKTNLADINAPENFDNDFAIYDGYLQEDEDGQEYYKFGITRHIRNVIENDSTNVKLGLRVCSSISQNIKINDLFLDPDAYNPTGIVLFGNQSGIKPPVLKIYYTEVDE